MPAIDPLFEQLLDRGGSDLHLAVGHPPMMRAGEELVPLGLEALTVDRLEGLLFEFLDDQRRAHFATQRDLAFSHSYADRARFRASYFFDQRGPGAVFRSHPRPPLTATDIGIPGAIRDATALRSGLAIVAGRVGSGKTTTLAGLVSHLNETRAAHLVTIDSLLEIPQESQRCEISQREVGVDTPSWTEALHDAARDRADVVVMGSLAEPAAIRAALDLASSGSLVLAGCPAKSVAVALEQLVGIFAVEEQPRARAMLADSLRAAVAGELIVRADGAGRVSAFEVLVPTPALVGAIRDGRWTAIPGLIEGGGRDGLQSMDDALETLVRGGVITPAAALAHCRDAAAFGRRPGIIDPQSSRSTPDDDSQVSSS